MWYRNYPFLRATYNTVSKNQRSIQSIVSEEGSVFPGLSCPEQARRCLQNGFLNLEYPLLDSELQRGPVPSESSLQPSPGSVAAPSWLFIVFSQVLSSWFLHFDLQGSLPRVFGHEEERRERTFLYPGMEAWKDIYS